MKHTLLFLAADPTQTYHRAHDEECAAIERELRMAPGREDFDFRSKWVVSVDELMRHLNELQPTIVHFSGHGADPARGAGIFLHEGPRMQYVGEQALAQMIASASPATRLVVLNACYTASVVEALRAEVDCVVGMDGRLGDAAARSFAVAFYRALGNGRSIGNAVQQAAVTLAAKEHINARPVCMARGGLAPEQLYLSAAQRDPLPAPPASAPAAVDIGILTIRDDEFRAVLAAFPDGADSVRGARTQREYALRSASAGRGARYRLALLRQIEQGNGEAQSAARDLIEDFAPRLILVVGIAGTLPSADVTLGDVVLSTHIHDFTVDAHKAGEAVTYSTTGGPVPRALASAIANLAAREAELGDWTAGLPAQPPVSREAGKIYGPPEWQAELLDKLAERHAGAERRPIYADGPIASSDRLVKDPALVIPWLATARKLLAVEMESAGVYRAAQERCPMLAIRGISDIVGLKRAEAWTKYACAAAAAFARGFLQTRPVPLR